VILNIYGRNTVLEALRSRCLVEEVWIAESAEGRIISQIRSFAERKGACIKTVPKNQLQKMAGAVVHQGVTARIVDFTAMTDAQFRELLETKTDPVILLLDQIQYPHNLGAIIRTAEVAGVDAVVIPFKSSAGINETIAKTSAGALFHVPVHFSEKLDTLIFNLNEHGLKTLAAVAGEQRLIYDVDMRSGIAIVIGSEGKGVRKNIATICRERMAIPQAGLIGSLNASVATGVILFELVRQRRSKN